MEINEIQKVERRDATVTIRIPKRICAWMKENNVSPTALFMKSVDELVEKTNKTIKTDETNFNKEVEETVEEKPTITKENEIEKQTEDKSLLDEVNEKFIN